MNAVDVKMKLLLAGKDFATGVAKWPISLFTGSVRGCLDQRAIFNDVYMPRVIGANVVFSSQVPNSLVSPRAVERTFGAGVFDLAFADSVDVILSATRRFLLIGGRFGPRGFGQGIVFFRFKALSSDALLFSSRISLIKRAKTFRPNW